MTKHIVLILLLLALKLSDQTLLLARAVALNPNENDNDQANQYNVASPKLTILPMRTEFSIPITAANTKSLTCKPEHAVPSLFSQIQWNGPNSVDNHEELKRRHKIVEDKDRNSLKLFFTNPTTDDSGIYYCTGLFNSEPYNSSIKVKFEIPLKMDPCHERQYVVKGDTNAKITCIVTGETPVVTIYKDSQKIHLYQGRYKGNNNEGLSIAGAVNESDAGTYLFVADSQPTGEYGQVAINVEVNTPPEFPPRQDSGPEFYGVEGEKAYLQCNALGKPRPLVNWYSPKGRNLTGLGNYHVNREEGSLIIDRVNKEEDLGNFKCVAYNSVDSIERKVSMAVYTRPMITKFENKTADENTTVTLECRATGLPRPKITIRKAGLNQRPFEIGDSFTKDISEKVEEAGSNVYIYLVTLLATKHTSGLIYCSAENLDARPTEAVGYLHINTHPDLSATPAEATFKRNYPCTLICHVQAYPPPTITWFQDRNQIINGNISTEMNTDGTVFTSSLTMPNDGSCDRERFTCRATNLLGQSEKTIITRFAQVPGPVMVKEIRRSSTFVDLQLSANDGYDRIKSYSYSLSGVTTDLESPIHAMLPPYYRNETIIDNSPTTSVFRIANLLPRYRYSMNIRAINDVGIGPLFSYSFDTTEPTPPTMPIIVHPNNEKSTSITSDYQNGYLLKWNPPEFDNGSPIKKYTIKTIKLLRSGSSTMVLERTVEQMSERPLHARLGPLETNQEYKIEISALNSYGRSPSNYVTVYTDPNRPSMPEYEPSALSWLIEPSTPTIIAILITFISILIIVDLVFHFCYQIGATYTLRNLCCPQKASSVISDTTYP